MTKTYPGRLIFVVFNVAIALVLMEANMFDILNFILAFYANFGIAWIVTVASDIVLNKYLFKLSPKTPEFRRGMLYNFNPVGLGSLALSGGISLLVFFGVFGLAIKPYSPIVAVIIALIMPPLLAFVTRGKYYLRRTNDDIDLPMFDKYGNPSGEKLLCHVSGVRFERPDMMLSATLGHSGEKQYISSLLLSTDKTGEHVLPPQKPKPL